MVVYGVFIKETPSCEDVHLKVKYFYLCIPTGVWFMHCHLLFHSETGMSLALEVLNNNGTLPPVPPEFPRCRPFEVSKGDFRQGKSLSSQVTVLSRTKKEHVLINFRMLPDPQFHLSTFHFQLSPIFH